jgi:hypothetical protein
MTDIAAGEPRSAGAAHSAGTTGADEPIELKYARQTRNAATFLAVLAGVIAAVALVGAIVAGVQLAKINDQLSGGGTSNCASVGGTDLSC